MKKKYLSTSELPIIFGKSQDWFRNRIGTLFMMNEHIFQIEKHGGLFWDINAIDDVIRKQSSYSPDHTKHDELIQSLLQ